MSDKAVEALIARVDPDLPVLIAGPTASGKSALALAIAEAQGGIIVNADASQIYSCWRIITARPSPDDEARAPHHLYGHIAEDAPYSTGHWLREIAPLLSSSERPILVGGTGLYFRALTEGLADIPPTPRAVRTRGDNMTLAALRDALDPATAAGIDRENRARVQRAWEVWQATGRGLADWQSETGAPLLPPDGCTRVALRVDRDWLNARIAARFAAMIKNGALEEIARVAPRYDARLPAHRAIGVPELIAHHRGEISLDDARDAAVAASRRYAKRQRTWQRSKMADWLPFDLPIA